MRLTFPYQTERLGPVKVYGVQHVFELDSGPSLGDTSLSWGTTVAHIPYNTLVRVQRQMAIVVPCRDERLKLLEGVLAAVPHECLVILVSNSQREPVDRYAMEVESVERFCRFNHRSALVVHQRDPGLADAFAAAGYPHILSDGRVADGKGEGMMVGIALASLAGREYVGFVDADNYVPGSVTEYVNAYAADFALARTPYSMVRICWQSKPKVVDGSLFFSRWGRVSETTNRFLNLMLAELTGFGTEAIRTGNAGEHAMSLPLALRLRFASGYAVEPFELIDLFERFGTAQDHPMPEADVMRRGIEIYQVETRNPHFHEDKGDAHIEDMRLAALATIFDSEVCPPRLRDEIREFLKREGVDDPDAALTRGTAVYPPLETVDWESFARLLRDRAVTFAEVAYPDDNRIIDTPPLPLTWNRRTGPAGDSA
ncbi:MAG: mannosyl-3-phosphoglycerate synthase [Acidimicrobiia bacterium]|nr:MAG: mannosyl-3-phosphoglycerate synthase [Acidimicrobiia bacterium]